MVAVVRKGRGIVPKIMHDRYRMARHERKKRFPEETLFKSNGAPRTIRTFDLLVRRLVQVLFLEGSSLV